jgi:hypothetical protein
MRPFPGPNDIWTDSPHRWHLYALPHSGQPALAQLIEKTRTATLDALGEDLADALALVKPPYVHATCQMISLSADSVEPETLAGFTADLRERLATRPPFTLRARWPQAGEGGVEIDLYDPDPLTPWKMLSDTARETIATWFGPAALGYDPPPPHLSIAYCVRAFDSGIVQRHLRQLVRLPDAAFHLDALHLLRVCQNGGAHTYEWAQPGAVRLPLGSKDVAGTAPQQGDLRH